MQDADDDTSEDESRVASNGSYYAAHVIPRCEDAFWEKLYQSFATQPASSNYEAPTNTKKSLDFELMLDAETTCGSGSSDTDTTQSNLLSTDSEMKACCLTSSDEVSDIDLSTGKARWQLKDTKTHALAK